MELTLNNNPGTLRAELWIRPLPKSEISHLMAYTLENLNSTAKALKTFQTQKKWSDLCSEHNQVDYLLNKIINYNIVFKIFKILSKINWYTKNQDKDSL